MATREWDPAWGVWVVTNDDGTWHTESEPNVDQYEYDHTETYDDGY